MVANAPLGISNAMPTSGDTNTSATPVTSQCANVFATTMSVNP